MLLQVPLIRKIKLLVVILIGPTLVFSILFAINNLLITYEKTERTERRTIWSLVQISKEARKTLYDGNIYLKDSRTVKQFQTQYEVLWSRIPVALVHLENEESYNGETVAKEGFTPVLAVTQMFDLVKSAETVILAPTPDPDYVSGWLARLNVAADNVTKNTMHNIIDDNSDYSDAISETLLNALLWVGATILLFFCYIALLVRTLWQEYQNIQYLMQHDTLTGLASREFTMKALEKHIANKQDFTVVTFDLNKFKAINDTFGHHVGDSVLIHLAAKFEDSLCGADNIVGRMGGDEFLWISPNTDRRYIEKQYAIFLQSLEKPYRMNRKYIKLHLSAGGGLATDYDFNLNRLLEQIDAAMYEAKQQKLSGINWCQAGSKIHRNDNTQNNNNKSDLETPFMKFVSG